MKFISKITGNPLFRVSSLNSVSVGVRIAGGLVASKVIALFIGPAGLALVGNFRNFLSALDIFSTLGFQQGVIKYVAENDNRQERLQKILATVFISVLIGIAILSTLLLLLSVFWSRWIFGGDEGFAWVFRVVAFSLPWYTGNLILIAVLNGLGQYKRVIYINIWGNITGVLLSALLIWQLKVTGALLGLIISPLFMFVVSAYLLHRQFPRFAFLKKKNFDMASLRGLLSYSLMSLVTAILTPVVFISIRNNLYTNIDPDEAGFWEAMNRISMFYFMFITTLLTVYFLPKLSVAQNKAETRSVFRSYYKGILPVFAAGLALVYFLREFIVRLLFTKKFLPMTELFFWQVLGDLFKACALILAYEFFARKMTKTYIVTETASFTLLYFSSRYLISLYGSEGAVMAHALTYGVYLVVLTILFRKKLN